MPWTEWKVSDDRTELIGPCGCRVENSFDGVKQARTHQPESCGFRPEADA